MGVIQGDWKVRQNQHTESHSYAVISKAFQQGQGMLGAMRLDQTPCKLTGMKLPRSSWPYRKSINAKLFMGYTQRLQIGTKRLYSITFLELKVTYSP
jgi:hypothetical protein